MGEPKRRVVAATAAGTVKRSAIAARVSGVRTVAKAISDRQGCAAGENANNKSGDGARVAVEGGESYGQVREDRERVDREREQQQRTPIPATLRTSPMTSMVDGSVTKGRTVAPPPPRRSAGMAAGHEGRQRKSAWDFRRRLVSAAPNQG
jgi:hypothetical protein